MIYCQNLSAYRSVMVCDQRHDNIFLFYLYTPNYKSQLISKVWIMHLNVKNKISKQYFIFTRRKMEGQSEYLEGRVDQI